MALMSFDEYIDMIYRGVRVRSLRKLLLFAFLMKNRLKYIDWTDWISRDVEGRGQCRKLIGNYLSCPDKEEISYFEEFLGSERLVRDYWKTLYNLLFVLGLL